MAYWQRQLDNAPTSLELPFDRPRRLTAEQGVLRFDTALDPSLVKELHAFAQRRELPVPVVLAAVQLVLLFRQGGQSDLCLGVVDGACIDGAVLRCAVVPSMPVTELLEQVHMCWAGAQAHSSVTLAAQRELLDVGKAAEAPSRLQSLMAFGRTDSSAADPATFDLCIRWNDRGSNLDGSIEASAALYDLTTLQRMAGHWTVLLQAMLQNPSSAVIDLPWLTSAETDQLLVQWNDTTAPFPQDHTVHQLFEAQVERTPDAVALVYDRETLTYGQVNAMANRLAHHLIELGVGPDKLVGVCMERSLEMVISLMAILKAGGAYVPLDPEHPADRLSFMLADTAAGVVLTQQRLMGGLPHTVATVLPVDEILPSLATTQPEINPVGRATPDSLAYCIYTSGSTGQPKGVLNEHRGIVNRLWWMPRHYGMGPDDVVLQKTPYAFDVSLWEFFCPLISGARMIIARPGGHRDPNYLNELIDQEGITAIHFVPSMLQAYLAFTEPSQARSLRRVFCSGEALPPAVRDGFFRAFPGCELHNLYGPTEAAVEVTCVDCRASPHKDIVPIGRPIANIRMYVLDVCNRPVPVGVSGEIHIGGVGVARGYLNRADLTAEKFVPDPFAPAGCRMYRTGDLGRFLPDGNIEYLGRLDHQVKVRGYRIELGEIETTLLRLESIREAVVIARPDEAGEQQLVAYVSCANGVMEPSPRMLRDHLLITLPAYMVPAVWVFMAGLPLNGSGKINRKALPEPASVHTNEAASLVPPQSDMEQALLDIWQTIWPGRPLGRDSCFMTAGGTSLLALRVSALIRQRLGREVLAVDVMRHSLLWRQAELLHVAVRTADRSVGGVADELAVGLPIVLTHGQRALLSAAQFDPVGSAYMVPVALVLSAPPEVGALQATFERLAERHPLLRMRARYESEGWKACVSPVLPDHWWTAHSEPVERPTDLVWSASLLSDVLRPWGHDGVMRVDLWPMQDGASLLVWTVHHAVIDETAVARALDDLQALLTGADLPPPLGLGIDLSELERQAIDFDGLRQLRERLEVVLDGHPPALPRPPGAGRELVMPQSARLAAQLQRCCQAWGCTPFPVLLSAFGRALQSVFGVHQAFVSSPFSRRDSAELLDTVNYWLDVRLLEAGSRPGETRSQTLRRVLSACVAAQDGRFQPMDVLAEQLTFAHPELTAQLMQFGLTWRHEPSRRIAFGTHSADLIRTPQLSSRYGLCLHVAQQQGELVCSIEALEQAFDDGSVARVWQSFERELAALADTVPEGDPTDGLPEIVADGLPVQSETLLKTLWAEFLSVPAVTVHPASHFVSSGGSSLLAMHMGARLQKQHGLKLDFPAFLANPTFAGLCANVRPHLSHQHRHLLTLGAPQAKQLFVLIPGVGGHAVGLYALARAMQAMLPETTAVGILDLEGLLAACQEGPDLLMQLLVKLEHVLDQMSGAQLLGLGGFSLGGLLALQLARRRSGKVPLVCLLDSYAPRATDRSVWRSLERRAAWVMLGRCEPEKQDAHQPATDEAKVNAISMPERWAAVTLALQACPSCAPLTAVHLLQARASSLDMGLLWRRGTNGFVPSHYGAWTQSVIMGTHLDLPRRLVEQTASVLAGRLHPL